MSERFYVKVNIGGSLPKKKLSELCDVLEEDGLGLEPDSAESADDWKKYLLNNYGHKSKRSSTNTSPLSVQAMEVSWGDVPELEDFCQSNNLSYALRCEGTGEYAEALRFWEPGMENCRDFMGDSS